MSSENRGSESSEERTSDVSEADRSEDGHSAERTDASGRSTESTDEPIDLAGPPSAEREASEWGGYVLAALLATVFLVGILRLVYPTASILVIGTTLALFGLAIGLLAVRERLG